MRCSIETISIFLPFQFRTRFALLRLVVRCRMTGNRWLLLNQRTNRSDPPCIRYVQIVAFCSTTCSKETKNKITKFLCSKTFGIEFNHSHFALLASFRKSNEEENAVLYGHEATNNMPHSMQRETLNRSQNLNATHRASALCEINHYVRT